MRLLQRIHYCVRAITRVLGDWVQLRRRADLDWSRLLSAARATAVTTPIPTAAQSAPTAFTATSAARLPASTATPITVPTPVTLTTAQIATAAAAASSADGATGLATLGTTSEYTTPTVATARIPAEARAASGGLEVRRAPRQVGNRDGGGAGQARVES